MNIYDFRDPAPYLRSYLDQQPKRGHGLLSQWAKSLSVSTTLLSQILAGNKKLSLELADGLAELLGLGEKETDYFLLLVEFDRAGSARLKKRFKQKVIEAQQGAHLLKNRIEDVTELSLETKAQYYSSWTYSGLRNLLPCQGMDTLETVAEQLKLPRAVVADLIEFLIRSELIKPNKNGWQVTQRSTYLSSDSPLVKKHHQNWRLRALQKMDENVKDDLFYTSPLSLSNDLALSLRKSLVDTIQDLQKKVAPSPSETVRCLSIDWFEY